MQPRLKPVALSINKAAPHVLEHIQGLATARDYLAMACDQHADRPDPVHPPSISLYPPAASDPDTESHQTPAISAPAVPTLSVAELIQGISGCRNARLPDIHAGINGFAGMGEAELKNLLGVTCAGARRLALAFELHRRLLTACIPERPACRQPEDVAVIMRPLIDIDHERLWCLPLDVRSRLIGRPREVSRGDVDGTDANPRAILRIALLAGATSMVVVHNHPGGDPTPSAADTAATQRIVAASRAIHIPLSDHVIVTAQGAWCSMRRAQPELFA